MRTNKYILEKLSNTALFSLMILMICFKVIVFLMMEYGFLQLEFGGGSDANYYHSYAQGFTDSAVNIWPVLLRKLNDFGLYSRDLTTYFLFLLSLFIIPILVTKISGLRFKYNQKYYLYAFLISSIYPTMFFFSTDIFRDVFMLFCFLLGCLTVKKLLEVRGIFSIVFYSMIYILIGFFLISLRPYLGYTFLISILFVRIKFTSKKVFYLGVFYLLALFVANYMGFLNLLTEYRAGFEEAAGGSTLGLSFSNPIMFVPNFILSFLGQMLGLYVTNPSAVFLLLFESIPFFYMFVYILRNIKLADKFVRFLIIFFVLYGSVWLIGNDNLGTAVRLRLYNYLAIYVCFFYILRLKSSYLTELILNKTKGGSR